MKLLWDVIFYCWDILAPRFITEDVALQLGESGYTIVCSMIDINEDEVFDGIATMRIFNFFGAGLFPKMVGEVRPWVTRHQI